jgi:general stress protein YciG
MSGTVAGGKKAAKTNKKRYGEGFYTIIGRKGGIKSRGGFFSPDYVNPDGTTGYENAVAAGRKGGKASGRLAQLQKGDGHE